MTVSCPSCGEEMQVRGSAARVRCPQCGDTFFPKREARLLEPPTGAQMGLGIASLCLGVLGVALNFACCLSWAALPFGVVGLSLGGGGLVVAFLRRRHGMGLPIAGTATNALALLLTAALSYVALRQAGESAKNIAGVMNGMGNLMQSAERIQQRQIEEQKKRQERKQHEEEQARQAVIAFLLRLEAGQFKAAHESAGALLRLRYPTPERLEAAVKQFRPTRPAEADPNLKMTSGLGPLTTCAFEYRPPTAPGMGAIYRLTAGKESGAWKVTEFRAQRLQ